MREDQEIDRDNEQFNQGVTHVVEMLARAIGAEGWVAGDGSEDYDSDLQQTLMNILAAKGLYDPDTGVFATLPPTGVNVIGRVLCKTCQADCTRHHLMCDEALDDDDTWCPKCFEATPCGQGKHGEGCATVCFSVDPLAAAVLEGEGGR